MKNGANELTGQFKAVILKFQTAYEDIARQINAGFAARDARIAGLEERVKALEERKA